MTIKMFNGKAYVLDVGLFPKSSAETLVRNYRKKGIKARITKGTANYTTGKGVIYKVWIRRMP